jgi:hypothetical protein
MIDPAANLGSGRLNPSALTPADAARLLSAAGGQPITVEMLQADVAAVWWMRRRRAWLLASGRSRLSRGPAPIGPRVSPNSSGGSRCSPMHTAASNTSNPDSDTTCAR